MGRPVNPHAAALVLLLACASTAGMPDWLDGKSEQYPRARYLVGVGSADELEDASARARTAISSILVTEIQSELRSRETSSGVDEADNTIIARTQNVLHGVEISETWRDEREGRFYALAVLKIADARRQTLEQLGVRAADANGYLARAESASRSFERARLLGRARAASMDYWVLRSQARVLGAAPVSHVPSPTSIDRQLDSALSQTQVAVDVRGSVSGEGQGELPQLREAVAEALNAFGFAVAADAEAGSPLHFSCQVDLERIERDPSYVFYRWQAAYELAAQLGGPVLVAASSKGGASGGNAQVARTKALANAEAILTKDLTAKIQSYLEREDGE